MASDVVAAVKASVEMSPEASSATAGANCTESEGEIEMNEQVNELQLVSLQFKAIDILVAGQLHCRTCSLFDTFFMIVSMFTCVLV